MSFMRRRICPDCQEPFNAGHPMAVCQPCAEREADNIEDQMRREDDLRAEFLMNVEERAAEAAWHLSFNVAA